MSPNCPARITFRAFRIVARIVARIVPEMRPARLVTRIVARIVPRIAPACDPRAIHVGPLAPPRASGFGAEMSGPSRRSIRAAIRRAGREGDAAMPERASRGPAGHCRREISVARSRVRLSTAWGKCVLGGKAARPSAG